MSENVHTFQPTTECRDRKVSDSQCDDSSCISKENDDNMTSNNHGGDADSNNVTSGAASISRSCPAGLDKSINGQSAAGCSSGGEFPAEGRNKYSLGAQEYCTEVNLSTVEFLGSSAPSEASSPRDERTAAKGLASECIMEPVESSPAKLLSSSVLGNILSEEKSVCVNHEAAGCEDGSPSAAGSLKRSHGKEHLNYKSPIRNKLNTQESPLHRQNVAANDGTDDLVDVRVCDICGDVGREALLALCSKCSDGAEHIYCMHIKMDAVPDGDWMCEECMDMQENKRPKQGEEGRSDLSNPSHLKEVNRGLVKKYSGVQQHADEIRTKHSGKAPCLSGKRHGPDIDGGRVRIRKMLHGSSEQLKSSGCARKTLLSQVSSIKAMKKENHETRQLSSSSGQSSKKVTEKTCSPLGHRSLKLGSDREVKPALNSSPLQKTVHPLNKSGSGGRMLLTRVSSLKLKGKEITARQVSSIGHQSPKEVKEQPYSPQGHQSPRPQQQLRTGKLSKSKSINIPESNKEVQWQRKAIQPDVSSKDSANRSSNKNFPERKLFKSLSFNTVSTVPPDVSDVPSSHSKQDLRYGIGNSSTKTYDSAGASTPRLGSQFSVPDGMKVDTHRTKVCSDKKPHLLRNKLQCAMVIQANGNSNLKPCEPLPSQGQNCAITSVAVSIGETASPSHLSIGVRSPMKSVSYSDQKANQSPQKSEVLYSSGTDKAQLAAADMVLPVNLHPMKETKTFTPGAVVDSGITAVPESEFIWKGVFKLAKSCKLPDECSGIQAHLSTCASSKVVGLVHKFRPILLLKEAPRVSTWPIQFQRKLPTEQDIAIYFFAEDLESYSRSYRMLLDGMVKNDLALEADFDGIQLLVFPSSLLPLTSQRWNALSFLWGVFRVRKVDNSIVHSPSMSVVNLNQALTACLDQGFKHDVTPLWKVLDAKETETVCCNADRILPADDSTEKASLSDHLLSHDNEKEKAHSEPDWKSLSKPYTPPEQPDGDNTVCMAVDPDGNCNLPCMTRQEEKKPDVASGSSFSVDSGPSGSSDGCAKPDEGQVEQYDLNLDLSLRTGSERLGEIDLNLDLVLGFPGTNKYQSTHFTKDNNNDGSNSLVLSLGMPC